VIYRQVVQPNPVKKPATRAKLTAEEKEQKAQTALINRMGVDPEHDWKAHYEVLPGKEHVVAELKNWLLRLMKFISQRTWTVKEKPLLAFKRSDWW
jgi:hypothetical protein